MRVIAPPAPPCFESRDIWIEYVASAQAARKGANKFEVIPLVIEANGEPSFNPAWPYCYDCNAQHSHRMTLAGRCDPEFLKRRAAESEAARA